MDKEIFKDRLRFIFASFGKSPGSETVIDAVWARVKDFPNTFMEWATEKLCNCEKLPGNLGLELSQNLWSQYRRENPDKVAAEDKTCRDCKGEMEGSGFMTFRWVEDHKAKDGGYWDTAIMACVCGAGRDGKTKQIAKAQGFTTMPIGGFDGGSVAFIRSLNNIEPEQPASKQNNAYMQSIGKFDSKEEYFKRNAANLADQERAIYERAF